MTSFENMIIDHYETLPTRLFLENIRRVSHEKRVTWRFWATGVIKKQKCSEFKDTCKRDLKSASIDIQSWESLAESRDSWRAAVHCGTKQAEQDRTDHLKEKRAARKRSCSIDQAATFHTYRLCGKDCHSRIGLHSHTRRCSDQN